MEAHMTLFKTNFGKLLIVVLATSLSQCVEEPTDTVIDESLENIKADYVIFGLTDYLTRDGVREALVEADTAYFYRDSTVVILQGNVRLWAYNRDSGLERAQVSSSRGRLDTTNNSMVASGNAVLLIERDGRRIESPELNYHPARDAISSDSATILYEGSMVVEGTGFDADLDFVNVRIRNGSTRGGVIR
jgi:LPS export ABC transporter protein LptC|tara:strand:+ start:43 stop:612 length:570 start_codon:yes stop_codon:yes gene_type:complete